MVKSKSKRAKKVYFPKWLRQLPEHSIVLPVKPVVRSVEVISPPVDGRAFNSANHLKKHQARLKLACVVRLVRFDIRQGFVIPPYTMKALIQLINLTAKRHFESGFSVQSLYQHKNLIDRLLRFCHRDFIQLELSSPCVDCPSLNPVNCQDQQEERLKLACVVRLVRNDIRQGFVLPPYGMKALLELLMVMAQRHFDTGFSQQFLYQHKALLYRLVRFCHRAFIQLTATSSSDFSVTDKDTSSVLKFPSLKQNRGVKNHNRPRYCVRIPLKEWEEFNQVKRDAGMPQLAFK